MPPACGSEIKLLPNNIVCIYAYIYIYINHSSRLKTAKGPPQQTDGTQCQRIDFRARVHPAVDRSVDRARYFPIQEKRLRRPPEK